HKLTSQQRNQHTVIAHSLTGRLLPTHNSKLITHNSCKARGHKSPPARPHHASPTRESEMSRPPLLTFPQYRQLVAAEDSQVKRRSIRRRRNIPRKLPRLDRL